jgi:hypothetical protein
MDTAEREATIAAVTARIRSFKAAERLRYAEGFVAHYASPSGYFVSTVGRDEGVIRAYIQKQEREDARLDQLGLWR